MSIQSLIMQMFNLQISYDLPIVLQEGHRQIHFIDETTKELIRNKLRTYRRNTTVPELTQEELTTRFSTKNFGVVHINREDIQFSHLNGSDFMHVTLDLDVNADKDMEFLIEETDEMIYYYDFPEPRKKQETVKTFISNSCLFTNFEQRIEVDTGDTKLCIENASMYQNITLEINQPFEYVLK